MSVRLLSAYRHEKLGELRSLSRFVLLLYCNWADDFDLTAYPSMSTLCSFANVEVRQMQRALRELTGAGLLEVIDKGGGFRKSTRYLVKLGVEPVCQWTTSVEERDAIRRRRMVERATRSA